MSTSQRHGKGGDARRAFAADPDPSAPVRRESARRAVVLLALALLAMGARAADSRADGTPLFAVPCLSLAAGANPHSLAIGDLNADGKPDLAVPNAGSNTVSVLLGNGEGTFATRTDFGTHSSPCFVAIGDLNGDRRPVLAAASYTSNAVSVLLNIGTSTTCVRPAPSGLPRGFQLLPSRPNPARVTSEIRFLVPAACTVDVALFDLAGRQIRSLASGEVELGEHDIRWDGRDDSGVPRARRRLPREGPRRA